MIIFDWDDTILPSSFVDKLQADNWSELPQQYHNLFREIEICSEKCLAEAAKHGEVILITNSDEGWVNYSAERYLPNLVPVLKNYRIVSARTGYEKFYPNQPLCWKAAAFAHEVNEHFCRLEEARDLLDGECGRAGGEGPYDSVPDMDLASTDDSSLEDGSISSAEADSPGSARFEKPDRAGGKQTAARPAAPRREIISFGDSIEERTAVKIVSDQLDALPKSVKFLNDPTPAQIVGQLAMLTHHMEFVCEHAEDLDLEISAKQAQKCAQGYFARKEAEQRRPGAAPSIFQRLLGSSPAAGAAGDPRPAVSGEDVYMEQYS